MFLPKTAVTLVVDYSIHPILLRGTSLATTPWDSRKTWATSVVLLMDRIQ